MDESRIGKTRKVKLDYPFENRPDVGQAIDIAPGVKWIVMPLPFYFKWINLWLIEEEGGYALVDTGMDVPDIRQAWEQVFENVLKEVKITRVICTHMHPDHVGLAGWITERFEGCELWMSRLEYTSCRMLVGDTGKPAPEIGVEFFRLAGWNEEALETYRQRFGGFGSVVYPLPMRFRRIKDGDVLRIGAHDWRAVQGAGHTPEHICLHCDELNLFISGDQLLPRISSNVSVHATEPEADPLHEWMESCAKLISETPEGVLTLPSHNEPFYGAHKRLAALIESHETSLDRLESRLDEPRRVVDCFTTLFGRKLGVDDMYAATGEAYAHLNYLMHRGRVERQLKDGVYLYSRAA